MDPEDFVLVQALYTDVPWTCAQASDLRNVTWNLRPVTSCALRPATYGVLDRGDMFVKPADGSMVIVTCNVNFASCVTNMTAMLWPAVQSTI